VRKLNEQGMTIILTTHYLEEAEEMCDEIAIINQGEVVARDSKANLMGQIDAKTMVIHPETPVTALPDHPEVKAQLRPDGALALSYHAKQTSAEAVLNIAHSAGIQIRDLRIEEADLEDVFLKLTSSR
jgi:ABC-2 type transport system ATP-binding protein